MYYVYICNLFYIPEVKKHITERQCIGHLHGIKT
jgi:hypothetical protein